MKLVLILTLLATTPGERDEKAVDRAARLRLAQTVSTSLCWNERHRAHEVAEINEERKYARALGGVVDMRKIYAIQIRVRVIDAMTKEMLKHLRADRMERLPCNNKAVKLATRCLSKYYGDDDGVVGCDAEAVEAMVNDADQTLKWAEQQPAAQAADPGEVTTYGD